MFVGNSEELESLCEHLNGQTRNAKIIQRASSDLFLRLFILDNPNEIFEGFVYKLDSKGISVFISSLGIKGRILVDGLIQSSERSCSVRDSFSFSTNGF